MFKLYHDFYCCIFSNLLGDFFISSSSFDKTFLLFIMLLVGLNILCSFLKCVKYILNEISLQMLEAMDYGEM